MILQRNVCTNLRFLRKELRLNQTEMAKMLDISQSYYGNVEVGNKNITYEMIGKLVEVYRISPNWLLLDIGDMYLPDDAEQPQTLPAGIEKLIEKKIQQALQAQASKGEA